MIVHNPSPEEILKEINIEKVKTWLDSNGEKEAYQLLVKAVNSENQDVAKAILEKYKEDPEFLNVGGFEIRETALHVAAKKGDYTIIKLLIDFGARLDETSLELLKVPWISQLEFLFIISNFL